MNIWTEKIYMHHRRRHKPPLAPSQVTYFPKLTSSPLFVYTLLKAFMTSLNCARQIKIILLLQKMKGKRRRRGAYPIYQNYLDSLKDFKPVLNIKRPFASWMKMFLPQALKCILDAKCASHFLVSPSLFSNNYCDNNIPRVHSSNILFIGHAVSWCYTLLLHIPAKFYTQSSQESDLSWTNLV